MFRTINYNRNWISKDIKLHCTATPFEWQPERPYKCMINCKAAWQPGCDSLSFFGNAFQGPAFQRCITLVNNIAMCPIATKFTVCGRDEVEASNCKLWSASTQSDFVAHGRVALRASSLSVFPVSCYFWQSWVASFYLLLTFQMHFRVGSRCKSQISDFNSGVNTYSQSLVKMTARTENGNCGVPSERGCATGK